MAAGNINLLAFVVTGEVNIASMPSVRLTGLVPQPPTDAKTRHRKSQRPIDPAEAARSYVRTLLETAAFVPGNAEARFPVWSTEGLTGFEASIVSVLMTQKSGDGGGYVIDAFRWGCDKGAEVPFDPHPFR